MSELSLISAVIENNYNECEILIKYGADIDKKNKEGITPLIKASEKNYIDICKLLIKQGAKVNCQDEKENTALHYASESGHKKVCKLLLQKSAKINMKNKEGQTPLNLAYDNHQKEVYKLLVENGGEGGGQKQFQGSHKTIIQRLFERQQVTDVKKLMESLKTYSNKKVFCEMLVDENAEMLVDQREILFFIAVCTGNKQACNILLSKDIDIDINKKQNGEYTPLYTASIENHKEVCKLLLEKGAQIDLCVVYTPLIGACMKGHIDICELLLEKDADVNFQLTDDGYTALHIACERNQVAISNLLLNKQANVNKKSNNGTTPIYIASEHGYEELCLLLISYKADVNTKRTEYRDTPLMVAVQNEKKDVCKLLLKSGANVNDESIDGLTPLKIALHNENESIFQQLLKYSANVDLKGENERTQLLIASGQGNKKRCKLLIDNGADVNEQDKNGCTPLIAASQYGHKEVCELLIENDANVNCKDKKECSPLQIASQHNRPIICKLLLKNKADIDNQDFIGQSALYMASLQGNKDVCELLLKNKPKIDIKDERGVSPLHVASEKGNYDICRLLIEQEAYIENQNSKGNTPLLTACFEGQEKICKLLLDNGANISHKNNTNNSVLHIASDQCKKKICELLLSYNDRIEIDFQNKNGNTALWIASANGFEDICKILVDKKADVNKQNINKDTALCVALKGGQHEGICKLLLDKGANINNQNYQGYSPLHIASENGYDIICKILLERKAEIDIKDNEGNTPLHLATQNDHKKICEYLIDNKANKYCKNDLGQSPLDIAKNKNKNTIYKQFIDEDNEKQQGKRKRINTRNQEYKNQQLKLQKDKYEKDKKKYPVYMQNLQNLVAQIWENIYVYQNYNESIENLIKEIKKQFQLNNVKTAENANFQNITKKNIQARIYSSILFQLIKLALFEYFFQGERNQCVLVLIDLLQQQDNFNFYTKNKDIYTEIDNYQKKKHSIGKIPLLVGFDIENNELIITPIVYEDFETYSKERSIINDWFRMFIALQPDDLVVRQDGNKIEIIDNIIKQIKDLEIKEIDNNCWAYQFIENAQRKTEIKINEIIDYQILDFIIKKEEKNIFCKTILYQVYETGNYYKEALQYNEEVLLIKKQVVQKEKEYLTDQMEKNNEIKYGLPKDQLIFINFSNKKIIKNLLYKVIEWEDKDKEVNTDENKKRIEELSLKEDNLILFQIVYDIQNHNKDDISELEIVAQKAYQQWFQNRYSRESLQELYQKLQQIESIRGYTLNTNINDSIRYLRQIFIQNEGYNLIKMIKNDGFEEFKNLIQKQIDVLLQNRLIVDQYSNLCKYNKLNSLVKKLYKKEQEQDIIQLLYILVQISCELCLRQIYKMFINDRLKRSIQDLQVANDRIGKDWTFLVIYPKNFGIDIFGIDISEIDNEFKNLKRQVSYLTNKHAGRMMSPKIYQLYIDTFDEQNYENEDDNKIIINKDEKFQIQEYIQDTNIENNQYFLSKIG